MSYNVAPGACGPAIAIPANNKPVRTTINAGIRGEGQVTLLRANASQALLDWAGYDYYTNGFLRGYATDGNDGLHIMYLDFGGNVDVRSALSTHIKVCNSSGNPVGAAIGYLTFVY